MKAARAAGLLALAWLTVSAASAHASTVVVAPIRDAGKHEGEALRHQLESGLSDGGLTVVGSGALAAAAKKQGLSPSDLDGPPVLMPVARAVGADAVLTGSVESKGKNQELNVRVFNLDGVELWSRALKLVKGRLASDIPRKVARAVTAALSSAPPAEGAASAGDDTGSGEDASASAGGDAHAAETTSEEAPKPQRAPPSAVSSGDDDENAIVTPKRHAAPVVAASADTGSSEHSSADSEVSIEGPPKEGHAETPSAAPPIIDVGVGFGFMSRSYRLSPTEGQDPSTGINTAINYSTASLGSPAIVLHGEFMFLQSRWVPALAFNQNLSLAFGVALEYAHSFSTTNNYQSPTTGEPASFGSSISRLSTDLTGRLYFSLLGGTGFVGLHGGILRPSFSVDENPLLAPSTRLGVDLGVGAQLPLVGNYFKVSVDAALAPAANPGVEETTDYGQTGKGSGYVIRGGLGGEVGYFGYGFFVDYAHFSDTFDGEGLLTSNGAVASERYVTYSLMLRGRY